MRKYAVIGLGKFGVTVAKTLYENGAEVIAIDKNNKKTEEVKGMVSATVDMDSTDEQVLKNIGIVDMDVVILAIGEVETSVLTSAILKKLGVKNIHAKVDSDLHSKILEIIGVRKILFPEKQVGEQLAYTLISPNVLRYEKMTSGHCLAEITVPKSYIGKSLQELNLPNEKKVHVIAVKYRDESVTEDGENIVEEKINNLPGANTIIREDDVLVLIGAVGNINSLVKEVSPDGSVYI